MGWALTMFEIGLTKTETFKVLKSHSAQSVKSGGLDVLATPALIAFMEQSAFLAVQPHLEDGKSTVGTCVEINHIAPTPIGMTVSCTSKLIAINNKELVFEVMAHDETGKIAYGIHKRFIIDAERFQQKANAKMK